MSRRTLTLVMACVLTAALSATALASAAKVKTGRYAGATSEQGGTVAFKVTNRGKRVSGFTATDGYNGKCQFSGGVGGIPTFTVKAPAMKVTKSRSFSASVSATVGPFSGKFAVKGKLISGRATGTVTEIGNTCGSSASNPSTPDYLETFTAKHA